MHTTEVEKEKVDAWGFVSKHTRHGRKVFLFCRCGFQGLGILHEEEPEPIELSTLQQGFRSLSQAAGYTDGYAEYECPACHEVLDGEQAIVMHGQDYEHTVIGAQEIDHVQVFDNRKDGKPTISLSICHSNYMVHLRSKTDLNQRYRLVYTGPRLRLTYNMETGWLYWIQGKRIINMTMAFPRLKNQKHNEILDHLLRKVSAMEGNPLGQFMSLCAEARGLKYQSYDVYYAESPGLPGHSLSSLFRVLKYPALQHLPFTYYPEHLFTKKIRKALPTASGAADLMTIFTGHSGKAVRKTALSSGKQFMIAAIFGHAVSDPSVMQMILDRFGEEVVTNRSWSTDFKVPSFQNDLVETMVFLRRLHTSDSAFAHRFFADLVPRTAERYTDSEGEAKIRYLKQPFSGGMALSFASDIYTMYKKIKSYIPEYEYVYDNDLWHMHEYLSRDYARIGKENYDIPLTAKELSWEKTVGDITFSLAKQTYDLIDVGNALNLCVGSYDDRVMAKETTIVFGIKQEEIQFCFEVRKGNLVQAKRFGNTYPTKAEAEVIRQWAKDCEISTKHAYDLTYAEEEWKAQMIDEDYARMG